MRSSRFSGVLAAAISCLTLSGPVAAQTVTDLETGEALTPEVIANTLIGGGVTLTNVTYTGAPRALGVFAGGTDAVGYDSGVVLSSGNVQTRETDVLCAGGIEGLNVCFETQAEAPFTSTEFGTPGDAELDTLAGFPTLDAAILEFDFVPQFSTIQFRYVFGSEEYNDFVATAFNDVFAFYVNGVNCALVPDTNDPVSVNTIHNGNPGSDAPPSNPELFRDNVRPGPSLSIELDGLTTVLTCDAVVEPGAVNHLKLAIADASDARLDSAVFIEAGSFVSGTSIQTELRGADQVGPMIEVPAGTAVIDTASLMGVNAASASGFVSYTVYSDAGCTEVFADAGIVSVSGPTVPASDPVVLDVPGTYYWVASYSGDDVNNPSENACGDEVVTVTGPPVVSSCKVHYLGWIRSDPGKAAKIAGLAWSRGDVLRGDHVYRRLAWRHRLRVNAIKSESLTCTETTATLEGRARVGLRVVDYRIDLTDGDGKLSDSYRLRLSDGFDSGVQPLLHGHVVIRPL